MANIKQHSFNEWLVFRSKQGDEAAFRELILYWRPRYYLYALRRLENREAAQDVTQDALLSISRGIGRLDDPGAYTRWGFRILERRCADWLRKTIRDRELLTVTDELPEVAGADNGEDYAARESLERVLLSLDSRLATVLRLYYLEDLSLAAIAEVLDIPVGTVKSRLYYGRKLFTAAVEQRGDTDD